MFRYSKMSSTRNAVELRLLTPDTRRVFSTMRVAITWMAFSTQATGLERGHGRTETTHLQPATLLLQPADLRLLCFSGAWPRLHRGERSFCFQPEGLARVRNYFYLCSTTNFSPTATAQQCFAMHQQQSFVTRPSACPAFPSAIHYAVIL